MHALQRGATPQYTLVAQELLRGIDAGDYPLGSLLPTEAELCRRYAVSRITARAAVRGELQSRGLVSRRAGIGTRIESTQTRERFVHVSDSIESILQTVAQTRFKVLRRATLVADATLSEELHVVRKASRCCWSKACAPCRAGRRNVMPACIFRASTPGSWSASTAIAAR